MIYHGINEQSSSEIQTTYLHVNRQPLEIQWKIKRVLMSHLDLTRKNLLFCLPQNGLPLGVKRAAGKARHKVIVYTVCGL